MCTRLRVDCCKTSQPLRRRQVEGDASDADSALDVDGLQNGWSAVDHLVHSKQYRTI